MRLKSIFAALVIVATPVCAQVQKPTRADVQKVFEIISGDEGKLQAYCDIGELGDQIEEANAKKDFKKLQELAVRADELGTKLSPEYGVLMNEIQNGDPDSEVGQQIRSALLASKSYVRGNNRPLLSNASLSIVFACEGRRLLLVFRQSYALELTPR
ncbi:MAG TPA: hypothetical protein VKG24_16010 [Pseudolabrys sp.]|jgi:hypothetical protein|nr:hypothetical protein [Pseudolabrys sp.]